jgi:hypothetical protein
VLPKESDRVRKTYGWPSSRVAKILIAHRETQSGRITMVLVSESLGF